MNGKRRFGKRLMSMALAIVLTLSCVPVDAYATEAEGQDETVLKTYIPDVDLPSNEELFAAYVEKEMYGYEFSFWGTAAKDRLNSAGQKLYDAMKVTVEEIAAGKTGTTLRYVDAATLLTWGIPATVQADSEASAQALVLEKLDFYNVFQALLADCPYDLYWFDKTNTGGILYGQDVTGTGETNQYAVGTFIYGFSVVTAYKGETDSKNNPVADTTKTSAPATAAANAKAVVTANINKSDYGKLVAYKDYICANVEYNDDAVDSNYKGGYGDPWQLIYVFDGDTTTNVVCEGYSKAFQYLCDLSAFSGDISCYSVTGIAGGPHMWNIVTMEDGKNYLVDVTNTETVGKKGELFLVGTEGSIANGYTFSVSEGMGNLTYTYDSETTALWGTDEKSILNLASSKYTLKNSITDTEVTFVSTDSWTYTGQEIIPEITVKSGGTTLIRGTHYELTYSNNVNAGTANIAVNGIGAYSGTKNVEFTINPQPIENYEVTTSEETFIYDGKEKQFSNITVKVDEAVIAANEYVVTYSNNVNAGIATACVTIADADNGNYTIGEKAFTFNIQKQSLTIAADDKEMVVNTTVPQLTYQITSGVLADGDALTAVPKLDDSVDGTAIGQYDITVSDAKIENATGIDATENYSITYTSGKLSVKEHVHAWTYSVDETADIITATCNAEGCGVKNVEITVEEPTVLQYDGTVKKVSVTQNPENTFDGINIVYSGQALEADGTAVKPGSYTATVSIGENSDTAQVSVEFTILPLELDKNHVVFTSQNWNEDSGDALPFVYFTGESQTPVLDMEVSVNGNAVYSTTSDAQDAWVTFSYENHEKPGTAAVTVTGNGTHVTGSVTTQFEIKYYETNKVATASPVTWAKSVEVNAPENFTISQNIDGDYGSGFVVTQQSATSEGTEVTYYLKETATGYITDAKKLTVKVDTSAPQFTGPESGIKITDRNKWWQELLTAVTFGTYKPQEVTIRATDALSGIDTYYYYLDESGSKTVKTAEQLDGLKDEFTAVENDKFGLETDGSYVIYAYAVDAAGNQSNYISSDGIIIDGTEPKISLFEDKNTVVDAAYEKAIEIGVNEAATYFYVIEKELDNSTSKYQQVSNFAVMINGQWTVQDGVVKEELNEAGTKGVVFRGLTPNTSYQVSVAAVDDIGNESGVTRYDFTTTKATPVFENLPQSLSGIYGDSIESIIANLPKTSKNGTTGTWSTSYTNTLNTGVHNVAVTFTPGDEERYSTYSTTLAVNIAAKDIGSDATITVDGTFIYSGSAHTPEPTVKLGETPLAKGTDYTVAYENNTDGGTATVMVTGTGNYTGTVTGTFKITKKILLSILGVEFADGKMAPTKEYDATTIMQKVAKVTFGLENSSDTETFDVSGNMAVTATYTEADAGSGKSYVVAVNLDERLSKNYQLENGTATFTNGEITKAPITIKADDLVIFVGEQKVPYTYTVEGLKGEDAAEEVVENVEFSTNATGDTFEEGTYTISITKAELTSTLGKNYALNSPYETGTLKVTKHEHEWDYVVNDTNNTITATCSGKIGTCPVDGEVVFTIEVPDECTYSGTAKKAKILVSKETDAFGMITPTYEGDNLTDGIAINVGKYSAFMDVGGKKVSVDFEITAKSLADANVQINGNYTYDGSVIVPEVEVILDGESLVKGTDYTVTGKDKNAGSATVTVTGKGNYRGSVSRTFTIERKAIIVNADTATKVYGSADPILTYTVDNSTPLAAGDVLAGTLQRESGEDTADYGITQGTLTNANNANYDITFVGNTFTITPKAIQKAVITLSQNSFEYSGDPHTPSVTVKDGTKALVENSDYTVSYENNTAVGTAKAIITLKDDGNYTTDNTLSAEFTITKKKLMVVSAVVQEKEYDGTVDVKVTSVALNGIIDSESVTVDTSKATAELAKANVGTYTSAVLSNLTLTGTNSGNYELTDGINGKFTVSTNAKITAKPLTGAVVKVLEGTYTYKAAEIKPKVTVVLNGKTFVQNTDYTVAYADNVNAGTATVTVTGCGNYQDTASGTFTIDKAKVVVTADDKIASAGDAAPALTYKVGGLLGSDKLVTEPTPVYAGNGPDMSDAGTCEIIISGADAGSNYTVQHINGVLYVKAADVDEILMDIVQEAIPETVPTELKDAGYDSADEIKEKLTETAIAVGSGYSKNNVEHYEVTLKYSLDGGNEWVTAEENNFPQGGIRIKLKYPKGTGRHTHDFVVSHMFTTTSTKLGTVAGQTEQPPVTKLDDGIEVILNGLSPVSIAWKEIPKVSSSNGSSSSGNKSVVMFADTDEYISVDTSVENSLIEEAKDELARLIGDSYGLYRVVLAADLKAELTERTRIKILINGITKADASIILHKGSNGWEVIPSEEGEGYVIGTFTSLSPVVVFVDKDGAVEFQRLTQTAKSSQPATSGGLAPTGDGAQPIWLLLLAAAALAGVGGVKYYKKKKGSK